jgi:hypothetical protein
MEKPKSELDVPGSSYYLAQKRLAVLAQQPDIRKDHKN